MASKQTPKGLAGNVARSRVPLRSWTSEASYSATDGRAGSSLADQFGRGSPSTTHAENLSGQIPGGFDKIDKRRSQDPTPVAKRRYTTIHEG